MTFFINDETRSSGANRAKIRRRLGILAREIGRGGYGLTLLITNDRSIRAINKRHRGVDQPTNVLSFPDTDEAIGIPRYLGDIVISMDTVRREARERGLSEGEHFYFYLIHGLLHLIGHDHELGGKEAAAQENETERLMGLIKHDW
jgi:rRNA maturation RNase YbeY